MLRENLGRKAVAGRPVVDVRQEPFGFRERCVVVADFLHEERMEVVLLVVCVRQNAQEVRRLGGARKLLCEVPQQRRAHADYVLGRDGRHQLALKRPVFRVLQGEKPF